MKILHIVVRIQTQAAMTRRRQCWQNFVACGKVFFAVAHPLMTRLRADRLKMLPGWVFDVAPPAAAFLSLLEESTSIDDVWLDMCMELDTDVFDPAEAAILCDRVPESLWFMIGTKHISN